MSSADYWRLQLEEWALPSELLDAVPWNPYEWPADLFARRDRHVADRQLPSRHTDEVIRRLNPSTLLDIGAGTGGSSLHLATNDVQVTALERDAGMANKLREAVGSSDLPVSVIEGSWPESAGAVGTHDVVTCSHVIHNVPDIVPFLEAMVSSAAVAVVIQEFETHPWAHLGPYYKQLHDLDRPSGPTVDDLVAVISEHIGAEPIVERWSGGRPMSFNDRDELFTFYGRRLVVPPSRWEELDDVLGPHVTDVGDGTVQLEERTKQLATVWWNV